MAEPIITVEAPRRVDRKGGIRTVADFIDGVERVAADGTTVHVSPGCTFPQTLLELCIPTDPEKTREGIDQIDGLGGNFVLYEGVECFLGGEDYSAAATALLDQGEDRALEAILVSRILDGATAATATSLSDAVAQADNDADDEYLGSPILIVNRGDASRLVQDGVLKAKDGGEIFTANGTRVLATSKVTAGTVIATGQIAVHRSSVEVNQVAAHTTNREYAIAERAYAIVIDCGYTAVYTVTGG